MARFESVCTTQITYSTTNSVHIAVEEGLLLRQVVGGQEYYECVVCSCSLSGIVPAKSHLEGSRHLRTLRNKAYTSVLNSVDNLNISSNNPDFFNPSQRQEPSSAPMYSGVSDEISDAMKRGLISEKCVNNMKFYECHVCSVMCTGTASVSEHLQGEQHNKKLRRQDQPDERDKGIVDIPATRFGNKVLSDEELIEQRIVNGAMHYHCRLCNSSCTGKENLNQHLMGRQHQRARRNLNLGDPAEAFRTSTPARDTTNLLTSLQTDIQEPITFDRLQVERAGEGYYCSVCKISCTGKENFDQHQRGKPHQKNLNKMKLSPGGISATPATSRTNYSQCGRGDVFQRELSPFMTVASTECVPSERTGRGEEDKDKSKGLVQLAIENGYILKNDNSYFCLVCDLTCSGIVPLTEHLAGDTHQRNLQDQISLQESMIVPSKSHSIPSSSNTTPCARMTIGTTASASLNHPLPQPRAQPSFTRSMSRHASTLAEGLQDIKVYLACEPLDDLFA
ncbi:zinc finger protein 346-like isoform X2 [Penaeus japonicus]|uniref:zinc finger protein 346-like isoform X2 n=1 Tax=Penaeus japonicus TaxID=27405 RepID=UPI001C712B72|nr:zinc finger protein 346-like isoform X2 [Penaeus japonicus]